MRIEFDRPYLLLILIPIVAALIVSYRFQNEKKRHVKIKQTLLTGILMSLLVLAMAGPQMMANSQRVATVFVVDASASVSDYRDEMKQFINDALKERKKRDYVGIVAFGGDAQVEQFVSELNSFKGVQTEVDANNTNLEKALTMAASMIPEGNFGRIILMTDGVENQGVVSRLSGTPLLSEKELLIYQINPEENPEVYVTSIDVGNGNQISKGEKINITVNIKSNGKTKAKVHLYQGRTMVDTQEVSLSSGDNTVLFTETAEEEGLATYTARVESEDDTLRVNNEYSTYLNIVREKRFLVVEDGGDATELVSIVNALFSDEKSHADVVNVFSVPRKINELMEYTGVIFVNVDASNVPADFMAILKSYVRDNGGGFVATGGRNSFGMGYYKDTVLEEILPVDMDPVEKDELPSIAICYVIDKSGSMSGGLGMVDKLEVAKKATSESMRTLIPGKDSVGVISFDDGFTKVVNVHKIKDAGDLKESQQKVGTIAIEGGTSILPALSEAVKEISKADAKIKHVILLTDGEDGYEFANYAETLKKAEKNGVTISTVAVGDGCNTELLENVAKNGGGSTYVTQTGDELPMIFTQEILLHRKSYIRIGDFVPRQEASSLELLKEVEFRLPFKAFIATKMKSGASELAFHYDEEEMEKFPILAAWQYGLGKTVAWTTDVTGEWSQNYSGNNSFAKMWANIFSYITTVESDSEVYAKTEVNGNSATVTYHAKGNVPGSTVEMTVTDVDGIEQTITLNPVGVNEYRGNFSLDKPGAYVVGVKRYDGNGQQIYEESATTVAMMQYSEEYRVEKGVGEQTINELKSLTGATIITEPAEAFNYIMRRSKGMRDMTPFLLVFAMVFFLYNIFYRRFRFDLIPEGTFSKIFGKISETTGKIMKSTARESQKAAKMVVSDEAEPVIAEPVAKKAPEPKKKAVKEENKAKNEKPQEMLDTSQLLKRMKK